MYHEKTKDAAKGKWRGILLELGIPSQYLVNKHSPCPLCGGKDRFRWDNKEGSGSYICSGCGAGDGMKLALEFTGMSFKELADNIDRFVGNIKPDPGGSCMKKATDEEVRSALRRVWLETKPIKDGDLASKYLKARGLHLSEYPPSLRFAERLPDGEGGLRPCMVALVSGQEGHAITLHRTFLSPTGLSKAEMDSPRKMMVGQLPHCICVRLADFDSGVLGVAEGIETALSASKLFDIPVWSVIDRNHMEKFIPPEGCTKLVIFGDNDFNFCGQASTYKLAERTYKREVDVEIMIPPNIGWDWNDEYIDRDNISVRGDSHV